MNEKILKVVEAMIENRWYLMQHGGDEVARRASAQHVELIGMKLLLTNPEYLASMYDLYVKEG